MSYQNLEIYKIAHQLVIELHEMTNTLFLKWTYKFNIFNFCFAFVNRITYNIMRQKNPPELTYFK